MLMYVKLYLDQETAKGLFRSSSQAATCYYFYLSDRLKVNASC